LQRLGDRPDREREARVGLLEVAVASWRRSASDCRLVPSSSM
jgi:hypothetical protein